MASEYAPLTSEILRRAAELVLREGGGMCVAVRDALGGLGHSNEETGLRSLYEASEGLWEADAFGYLRRFGQPGERASEREERAACLRRMADWLEAREVGHDG